MELQNVSQIFQNPERTISGTSNTVQAGDYILLCDTSLGVVDVELLEIPNKFDREYKLYIIDISGNAATNNITVNAPAGHLINGDASVTIDKDNGSVILRFVKLNSYSAIGLGSDGSIDYVSDIIRNANGLSLEVTGTGNGFSGSVPIHDVLHWELLSTHSTIDANWDFSLASGVSRNNIQKNINGLVTIQFSIQTDWGGGIDNTNFTETLFTLNSDWYNSLANNAIDTSFVVANGQLHTQDFIGNGGTLDVIDDTIWPCLIILDLTTGICKISRVSQISTLRIIGSTRLFVTSNFSYYIPADV
jgi:hypothetical protein